MSEAIESTSIVVQDGVATTIEPKLKGIAAAAREADAAVSSLKSVLSSIATSGLSNIKVTIDNALGSSEKLTQSIGKSTKAQTESYKQVVQARIQDEQHAATIRQRELSSLKADIIERSRINEQYYASIAAFRKEQEAADAASRQRELAALRADILERSKLQQPQATPTAAGATSITNANAVTMTNEMRRRVFYGPEQAVAATSVANAVNSVNAATATAVVNEQALATAVTATEADLSGLDAELNRGAVWAKTFGASSEAAATQTSNLATSTVAAKEAQAANAATANQLTAATESLNTAEAASSALIDKKVQNYLALKLANKELRDYTQGYANTLEALGPFSKAGNVEAQKQIAYDKQLVQGAMQKVAALKLEAKALQDVGATSHTAVTGVQAASGAIRVLEGNVGTNVRAAENFLVKVMGLGPVLQAAFPVIGAMALIGVIGILYDHVHNLITAFKELDVEQQKLATNAVLSGEKIIKAKREGFFTASNFARLMKGVEAPQENLEVNNFAVQLRQLDMQERVIKAKSEADLQGLKGAEQEKKRTENLREEISLAEKRLGVAKQLRDEYIRQLDAVKTIHREAQYTGEGELIKPAYDERIPIIGDPQQRKALRDQLAAATAAVGSKDLLGEKGVIGELQIDVDVLKEKLRGSQLALPLKEMGDATKAAREQLKQFESELGNLKEKNGGIVSPQQLLALYKEQRQRALVPNIPTMDLRVGNAQQAVDRQGQTLDVLSEKWKDQVENIGLYSEALRIKNEQDKIDLLLTRDQIDLNDPRVKGIKENVKTALEQANYQRALKNVYDDTQGPLLAYESTLKAIDKLEKDQVLTAERAVIERNKANLMYQQAIEPMTEYNHSLDVQTSLLKRYGNELQIETQIEEVRASLRTKGRDLDNTQIAQLRERLNGMQQERLIQSELNSIWSRTEGEKEKLAAQQKALNKAFDDGLLSMSAYKRAMLDVKLAENQLANDRGKGSFKTYFVGMLGQLVDTSKSTAEKLKEIWGGYFNSLKVGFADSIAQALVYGESLKNGVINTLRSAVAQLISTLIQLGVELLVISALEKMFPKLKALLDAKNAAKQNTAADTAKQTALAVASIATIALAEYAAIKMLLEPAWSLAEAISLISFGANAIGAVAGITAVMSAGNANLKLAAGGWVNGPDGIDRVPAMLTNGEFVVNRDAAQANKRELEAMNRGAKSVSSTSSASGTGTVGNTNLNVFVEHDGSTGVQVERISETEVRVIARQEADRAVRQKTPDVVASHLQNPNSRISKTIIQTNETRRKR